MYCVLVNIIWRWEYITSKRLINPDNRKRGCYCCRRSTLLSGNAAADRWTSSKNGTVMLLALLELIFVSSVVNIYLLNPVPLVMNETVLVHSGGSVVVQRALLVDDLLWLVRWSSLWPSSLPPWSSWSWGSGFDFGGGGSLKGGRPMGIHLQPPGKMTILCPWSSVVVIVFLLVVYLGSRVAE